jgi:hypothetical protein
MRVVGNVFALAGRCIARVVGTSDSVVASNRGSGHTSAANTGLGAVTRIAVIAIVVSRAGTFFLQRDVTRWNDASSFSADMLVHSLGDSVRISGFGPQHLAAVDPCGAASSMPSERCGDVVVATVATVAVRHDGTGII